MESNGYTQTESLLDPLAHINREHLAAMADAAVADQTEFNTSAPSSPTQKRKRSAPDSSPDSRRSKRSAPAAAMSSTPDAASAAYVESAVEAAQAAAQAANVNADFTALQQATVEHHEHHEHQEHHSQHEHHEHHEHHESADPANASSTAAAALGTMYPTLHIPQPTEETFANQTVGEPEHQDSSFGPNDVMSHSDGPPLPSDHSASSMTQNGIRTYSAPTPPKPAVGSEEWHKMRKDNHKEVERRRRETINEGINELAKIVPGCEKNKGSILQRAVAFITQLKENEAQNIEKWTLEKLLTEQAIQELSASNDKLKQECERAYKELTIWKHLAQNAGLQPTQQKGENTQSSS